MQLFAGALAFALAYGAAAVGSSGFRLARLPPGNATGAKVPGSERQEALVVQPEIVVPGDWLTDAADKFLILPLAVPKSISMQQCKILGNGDSLLVVVTEQPQDQPEDDALRKYKLVVGALKSEAGHDEVLLRTKLQAWLETEEDDEVRAHVQAALDSLARVRAAKGDTTPRTVSVPLGAQGLVQKTVTPASLLGLRGTVHGPTGSSAQALAPRRALLGRRGGRATHAAGIIRESFSVDIPYPVPARQVFVLRSRPDQLLVVMPLLRGSLEARGVSTGGRPFERLPVFGASGEHVAGPQERSLSRLADGLDMHMLADRGESALLPLQAA